MLSTGSDNEQIISWRRDVFLMYCVFRLAIPLLKGPLSALCGATTLMMSIVTNPHFRFAHNSNAQMALQWLEILTGMFGRPWTTPNKPEISWHMLIRCQGNFDSSIFSTWSYAISKRVECWSLNSRWPWPLPSCRFDRRLHSSMPSMTPACAVMGIAAEKPAL